VTRPIDEVSKRELRERVAELEAEKAAYKMRAEALEGLNACLRVQRSPSQALWKRLEKSHELINRLTK